MTGTAPEEALRAFALLANEALGQKLRPFLGAHRPGSYGLADLTLALLPGLEGADSGVRPDELRRALEGDEELRSARLSAPLPELLRHAVAHAGRESAPVLDVPTFLSAVACLPTADPAEQRLQDLLVKAGVPRPTGSTGDTRYAGLGYGTDLNRQMSGLARSPLLGREAEMEQVQAELLGGRSPVLVGEPGVGKSALAEGLAWMLGSASEEVPRTLRNLRLVALDVHDLVEDTGEQGALEKRLNGLVAHLRAQRHVVPFIDEVHSLLETGKTVSSLIINKLKQPLARGQIRVIGATTEQEYHATIGRDQALQERLPAVLVGEPKEADAVAMLLGRGDGLLSPETRRLGVTVSPDAVQAAVRLSRLHLPRERLPRKAVQLIAVAAGRKALALDRRKTSDPVLTGADVAAVLAQRLRVPAALLGGTESARLEALRDDLSRAAVGQAEAAESVLRGLHASLTGLRRPERPLANLVLYGPRGVGLTTICAALARGLCGGEQALLEHDMADFSQDEGDAALNRLRGAPPGYRDSGQWNLFSLIRSRSSAVVVFDRVEQIPPALEGCLGQMLDGSAADGMGQPTSFSKCLFVFVAGERLGAALAEAGEGQSEVLRDALGAKVAARIDAVVPLRPVADEDLAGFLLRQLDTLNPIDPHVREAAGRLRDDAEARAELVRRSEGRPAVLGELVLETVNHHAYESRRAARRVEP